MRKLSEQELEVLQEMIVSEGWVHTREHFGLRTYSATYKIDDITYNIFKEGGVVEAWEID